MSSPFPSKVIIIGQGYRGVQRNDEATMFYENAIKWVNSEHPTLSDNNRAAVVFGLAVANGYTFHCCKGNSDASTVIKKINQKIRSSRSIKGIFKGQESTRNDENPSFDIDDVDMLSTISKGQAVPCEQPTTISTPDAVGKQQLQLQQQQQMNHSQLLQLGSFSSAKTDPITHLTTYDEGQTLKHATEQIDCTSISVDCKSIPTLPPSEVKVLYEPTSHFSGTDDLTTFSNKKHRSIIEAWVSPVLYDLATGSMICLKEWQSKRRSSSSKNEKSLATTA